MKRIHFIVSCRVQGVFFRAFVKDKAQDLGLTGFVRNTEDKKIEVVAEGHELKLKKLIEECKKGPSSAIIEEVKVNVEPYTGEFKNFRIKY
ncbi:MAG TPA: acylphosphatase [Candidatus Nanoarchaeia archaeon]|nr:acylphosphatase [Candidatus Nanoarchaeia archaeon]